MSDDHVYPLCDNKSVLGSPVMNLRDKLVISICDSEDRFVTQTGGPSFLAPKLMLSQIFLYNLELNWIALLKSIDLIGD